MMKRFLVGCLLVFLLPPLLFGQNRSETTEVTAEGAGSTETEALKDAFRNAVQQAVGLVVDAETVVKNEDILEDQILTYSDGFIEKHRVLSKQKRDGIVSIEIEAVIKRRSLVQKLESAKVIKRKADGGSLFGEIVSQAEGSQDAKKLLNKALKGFPLNCLTAEIVEQDGKPFSLVGTPSKDKNTVRIIVRVKSDPKAYNAFSKRLCNTLDGIKLQSREDTFKAKPATGDYQNRLPDEEYRTGVPNLKPIYLMKAYEVFGACKDEGWGAGKTVIMVNTQRTSKLDSTEWISYSVDPKIVTGLGILCNSPIGVKLELLDEDGDSLITERFSCVPTRGSSRPFSLIDCTGISRSTIGRWEIGSISKPYLEQWHSWRRYIDKPDYKDRHGYVIAPFFVRDDIEFYLVPHFDAQRELSLTLDEIKQVSDMKVSLYFNDELPPDDPDQWMIDNNIGK